MSILCEKMMSLSMKNDFMTNQIYIFPLLMDIEKLSKELWELSEDVDKNIERMKEIAHVLVTYYMWDKEEKDKEKS
jgi:hypothetical protein